MYKEIKEYKELKRDEKIEFLVLCYELSGKGGVASDPIAFTWVKGWEEGSYPQPSKNKLGNELVQ